MTDHEPNSAGTMQPSQTPTDAAELPSMTFPTRPRFTLDDLQEIRIAEGDGESTLAAYRFDHKGEPAEKIATLDDLTRTEREAALSFILAHAPAVVIRRKPQQKAKKARRSPRLYNTEAVEFEPVDLDDLTPPTLPEIDPTPLEELTAGQGETAPGREPDGAESPQMRDNGKDGQRDGEPPNTRQIAQE